MGLFIDHVHPVHMEGLREEDAVALSDSDSSSGEYSSDLESDDGADDKLIEAALNVCRAPSIDVFPSCACFTFSHCMSECCACSAANRRSI